MSVGWGSVIRRARLERTLTQSQLAELTGVKQANISAIETGRREPSAVTLHRLLVACGFDLVATAGSKTIGCEPTGAWSEGGDELTTPVDLRPDLPAEIRARMLVAVLDASEAIVRSR